MADNTAEEPFEHKTSAESENLSDEIVPSANTGIIGLNQQAENMEAHYHTHPGHGKKTWREYFWEFLMLFLAVFCGFLAEYKLEHVLERQHEKQFANLLLSDLRADSLYYIHRNKNAEIILKKHEQFYDLMTASQKPTDKQILTAFIPLDHIYVLSITPGTYSQMKTSGGLRYVQKTDLVNMLQQYYEILIPRAIQISDRNMQYYTNNIISYSLHHFKIQDYDGESDSLKVANPVIMNRTPQTDQQLLNVMGGYYTLQRIYKKRIMHDLIAANSELIRTIREEYNIK
ncbi:MAG TPA: hypothetical protein VG890_14515 [Puia sp.]|nr:hypothetical protein [Puia sp.]